MENNSEYIHKIINLYEKSNFFKIYGLDFWITIIFIITCLILTAFIYITNHFNKVRKNWDKERCNPIYIPFAGYINPQKNKTNLEYTEENFKYCNNKFIENTEKKAMGPIYQFSKQINDNVNEIKSGWTNILSSINLVKKSLGKLAKIVINKLISLLIPLQFMFVKIKDFIAKMTGSLVGMIYTFYNSYKVFKLYLLNIVEILSREILFNAIGTLVGTISTLFSLIATAAILWFWAPWSLGALIPIIASIVTLTLTLTVLITFCTILFIIANLLHNFSQQVFTDINVSNVPKIPNKIKIEEKKIKSKSKSNK